MDLDSSTVQFLFNEKTAKFVQEKAMERAMEIIKTKGNIFDLSRYIDKGLIIESSIPEKLKGDAPPDPKKVETNQEIIPKERDGQGIN